MAALGSDFDGMIVPVAGLRDVSQLPNLESALRAAGHNSAVVEGIMGENALRLFEDVLG